MASYSILLGIPKYLAQYVYNYNSFSGYGCNLFFYLPFSHFDWSFLQPSSYVKSIWKKMYSFFQSLFTNTRILEKKSNQFCSIWILHIRKADKWFGWNFLEGRSLIKDELYNPTNTCRHNDISQHKAIYSSRILSNIQIILKTQSYLKDFQIAQHIVTTQR